MWTPDVYEGAPAPITGFLAAVSKGAIFVALLRWWMASGLYELPGLLTLVALVAGASMLVGNLLALLQDNIKRVLAYSSIAHMGYLLIVLVACGLVPQPGPGQGSGRLLPGGLHPDQPGGVCAAGAVVACQRCCGTGSALTT